jgi:glycosyltransferase involved in cell wall biosynthesis
VALGSEAVGAVVIGRNEGVRLEVCLRSVCNELENVVYVDSGSTDDSVELALRLGVSVINLSTDRPFTAARARNEGARRLRERDPEVAFVQFIDGDCELQPSWVEKAHLFLLSEPDVAVVCGRRRERHPETSRYNRLCDMEWDTPSGRATACGGDALVRMAAFTDVGGFCEDLIAGEEPDLCFRLRQRGWGIFRLDAEMTLHDASMTHAAQWWRRSVRSGYATAEAHHRRGAYEAALRRQLLSNVFWALPIAWPLWPLLWLRTQRRRGALYASHIVLGKIPHLIGQMRFWWRNLRGRAGTLIEYK